MAEWCTIESDPGIFTELIQAIGVKDVQVEELWSLGDEDFVKLKPVHGLVFLFKWQGEPDERPVNEGCDEGVFFANQVITNACATQAILSILLNLDPAAVDVGEDLRNFKDFAMNLPSDSRGELINTLDTVRKAHNSFSRPDAVFEEERKRGPGGKQDVFHFIAYVPYKGKVYELDGLKAGPICLGDVGTAPNADWVAAVRPHIQERMQRYSGSEIRFNLMALIKDQRVGLREQVAKAEDRAAALQGADVTAGAEGQAGAAAAAAAAATAVPADDDAGFEALMASGSAAAKAAQLDAERARAAESKEELAAVERKYEAWRKENIRRKHNLVPMAVRLLKSFAEQGSLTGYIQAAKDRQAGEANAAQAS